MFIEYQHVKHVEQNQRSSLHTWNLKGHLAIDMTLESD